MQPTSIKYGNSRRIPVYKTIFEACSAKQMGPLAFKNYLFNGHSKRIAEVIFADLAGRLRQAKHDNKISEWSISNTAPLISEMEQVAFYHAFDRVLIKYSTWAIAKIQLLSLEPNSRSSSLHRLYSYIYEQTQSIRSNLDDMLIMSSVEKRRISICTICETLERLIEKITPKFCNLKSIKNPLDIQKNHR